MNVRIAGRTYGEDTQRIRIRGHRVEDLSALADLPNLAELELYEAGNPDLTGIENLNLTRLTVYRDLSDLSRIATLGRLRILHVCGAVSDITPLEGLRTLTDLHLASSQVADLSPLAGHTALQNVSVASTPVRDLSPLAGCRLQDLNAAHTKVESLAGLALGDLRVLNLVNTAVSDLSPLAPATTLEQLAIDGTPITTLEALRHAEQLNWLRLAHTSITDLEPLKELQALRTLDIDHSAVTTLAPLKRLSLGDVSAREIPATDFGELGLAEGATVWTNQSPDVLNDAIRKRPDVDFRGGWRVSAPRPGVRLTLVGRNGSVELDAEHSRYLHHRADLDAGQAPDLSRWHHRLLRRHGATEPPDASDSDYWSRFLRLTEEDRAATPGLARHKLTEPGRWVVADRDARRLAESMLVDRVDGSTPEDLEWLAVMGDWLQESGGFECWVSPAS